MASTSASITLNGASAMTTGTTANFDMARSQVTAVVIPTGTITGGLVALEASQDNTNWVSVYVFAPVGGRNDYHPMQNVAFRYWRCSIISAITGGGTIKVTLMYSDADGGLI